MARSFIIICLILLTGCSGGNRNEPVSKHNLKKNTDDLIIFHAGSLSVPFKEIADSFTSIYPQVRILMESSGSVAAARKITDLHKSCDIIASADYKVIEEMLIPAYTNWCIPFASNEMAIVYTDRSKFCKEISRENWYKILLDEEVVFGRSDPNSDPCGYRAVLTIQLAENYYQSEGLIEGFLNKDLRYIRPKEVDLLALLETGTVDYIFLYRSVAEQHNLLFLTLPGEINLADQNHAELYSHASVGINGKQPGEITVMYGEPMIYGITILENAPNREMAELFLSFLLNPDKGQVIMERNGQPSVIPSYTKTYDHVPGKFENSVKRKDNKE